MALRRLPNLDVHPVPLDGDLARARVGALPLFGEPGPPVGKLRLARAGLVDTRGEVTLDVVDPRELPAQRLHALGGGREGHAARGRLRHQLRLPSLGGLDRLSEPRHPRLVGGLGVSRKGDPLLELGERPVGLLGLQRDLPRLHLDRLAMPVDPVVLPRRLLEVLLAGEPLRLSRMEGPLDLSDLPADRRHLGLEPRHSFLCLVQVRRDTPHLVVELAQPALARE